jgi:hypothetical protein
MNTSEQRAHRSARGQMALLVALAALASCGRDGDGTTGAAPAGTPLEIGAAAQLSLGAVDGDTLQEFDRVVTPFLLPDGRVVVPVSGARSMRVFSAQGTFVASLGRNGEGPGEFRNLLAAWPRGDTIEAFDTRLRRITRFLPDGSVEVVSPRSDLPDLSAVAGPSGDGWMLGGVASGGDGQRDVIVVQRFSRDGTLRGEVARAQGFARYAAQRYHGPEPLSPRPMFAVHRGRAYVAESLTPRIQVFGETGTLDNEITWTPAPASSASEAFRLVVDSAVAMSGSVPAAAMRQRLEAAPVPDKLSAFWAFLVDDEGFVWVRPYEPLRHAAALGGLSLPAGGPGGRWTIYSPDGVEAGTVRVPADLEPLRITADAVIGIARDALGVETVRLHALRRK